MARSSVSKTLRVGVDGARSKLSPLAGAPLTATVMPSTVIAWPETYGAVVTARSAAPFFSTA